MGVPVSKKKSGKRSSKALHRERLRNLKRGLPFNNRISDQQRRKTIATINRELGYTRPNSQKPSYRQSRPPKAGSNGLMIEGIQDVGEVIVSWLFDWVQKLLDIFHLTNGVRKIVKAAEGQE